MSTGRPRTLRQQYAVAKKIVYARADGRCEACGAPAKYTHHIHRVSETSIYSVLFADPANLLLLCDDCHALMHPLLRGGPRWMVARKQRGNALSRR